MPKQKLHKLKQLCIVDNFNNEIFTNFSPLSKELTKQLTKEEKGNEGIFFTPVSIIIKIIHILKQNKISIQNVLEPSCGSCEIINTLNKYFNNIQIHGIEKNDTIYKNICNIDFSNQNNNKITLEQNNFLKVNADKKYDLIIGNPPFFVMKKNEVDKKYYDMFEGRPNIFILFIIHSLSLLNNNGVIAFVLPSSFLNCLYYNNLRKEIFNKFKILDIISCKDDKFLETQQETIVIIFQKVSYTEETIKNNELFTFKTGDYFSFNTKVNVDEIKIITKNTKTLNDIGFSVGVGNVVWNQNKERLTSDSSKIRIIYSSDINKGELIMKKNKSNKSGTKHNYIDIENTNIKTYDKPILITSRGYGVGSYKFEHCIVDLREKYVLENHIIAIKPKNDMTREDILGAYKRIITSFNDERTSKFVSLYFGNSAMNTTELQYILPIY